MIKDHYKTLEVPALSSALDIKQAYRRLARQYHPDKNEDVERATILFQEIQIAYEILSNPVRRKTYDNELKHEGQYNGVFQKDHIINSEQIVKQTKDLLHYIDSMNQRAINYDALTDFILGILNKENMALLLRANNSNNNEQISNNILQASKGIVATRLFIEIKTQLDQLYFGEKAACKLKIQEELANRQRKEKQNKIVPYVSLFLVLLFALVMALILAQ